MTPPLKTIIASLWRSLSAYASGWLSQFARGKIPQNRSTTKSRAKVFLMVFIKCSPPEKVFIGYRAGPSGQPQVQQAVRGAVLRFGSTPARSSPTKTDGPLHSTERAG